MKTSELIAKGRDVLARGWCQGRYQSDHAVCAMGALRTVLGGNSMSISAEQIAQYGQASDALCDATYQMFGAYSLIEFNDAPSTTQQDILDIFDKTIAGLEEKGL